MWLYHTCVVLCCAVLPAAAFANTYQLRAGQFILFYQDTLHRLVRLAAAAQAGFRPCPATPKQRLPHAPYPSHQTLTPLPACLAAYLFACLPCTVYVFSAADGV